jgi:hypothetical protein
MYCRGEPGRFRVHHGDVVASARVVGGSDQRVGDSLRHARMALDYPLDDVRRHHVGEAIRAQQ